MTPAAAAGRAADIIGSTQATTIGPAAATPIGQATAADIFGRAAATAVDMAGPVAVAADMVGPAAAGITIKCETNDRSQATTKLCAFTQNGR
jgi:hypothetical protein